MRLVRRGRRRQLRRQPGARGRRAAARATPAAGCTSWASSPTAACTPTSTTCGRWSARAARGRGRVACTPSPTAATSRRTRRPACSRRSRRSGPPGRRASDGLRPALRDGSRPPLGAHRALLPRRRRRVGGVPPRGGRGGRGRLRARASRTSSSSRSSATAAARPAGDELVFFNFRPDRARPDLRARSPTRLRRLRPRPGAAAPPDDDDRLLGRPARRHRLPPGAADERPRRRRSRAGIGQLHAAETEKYPHVTYFLNGGVRARAPGRGADPRAVAARREDVRPEARDERRRARRPRRARRSHAAARASSSSTSRTPTWSATRASSRPWSAPSRRPTPASGACSRPSSRVAASRS